MIQKTNFPLFVVHNTTVALKAVRNEQIADLENQIVTCCLFKCGLRDRNGRCLALYHCYWDPIIAMLNSAQVNVPRRSTKLGNPGP